MSDEFADARARVGRVINDKWTVERLIGLGGMAAVYAGRHRNGARAALKILHPSYAEEPAVRERFLREGYAANKVEHPGAVRVLDDDVVHDGPDKGAAYLVMELLQGESLEERAARNPVSEAEFLTIADGVLAVLEAAHERGVVHRDLKPANIFLATEEDGTTRVKLLDFGLARLSELGIKTQFGIALGTPAYMSPEQAGGRADEIDARTDIFALGATGFRLLTQRRIHEAEDMQLIIAMATQPAPLVREVAPHVAAAVATVIDRAIAFAREARYQTASAMRADVRAAMQSAGIEVPVSARGTLATAPVHVEASAAPEASASLGSMSYRIPKNGSRWILPVVVLGAVAAGGGIWAVRTGFFDPRAPAAVPDAEAPVDPVADAAASSVKPKPSAAPPPKPKASVTPPKKPPLPKHPH